MNITDIDTVPLHVAYEEVCRAAAARGLKVTGVEIVGLVPKRVLIDAGKFYLAKQQRSLGISEEEILKIAVKSMSLDDLKPFNPKEKVIEYLMEDEAELAIREKLVRMSVKGSAPPSPRWSRTCPRTSAAGTTAGRNSPTSPKRAKP